MTEGNKKYFIQQYFQENTKICNNLILKNDNQLVGLINNQQSDSTLINSPSKEIILSENVDKMYKIIESSVGFSNYFNKNVIVAKKTTLEYLSLLKLEFVKLVDPLKHIEVNQKQIKEFLELEFLKPNKHPQLALAKFYRQAIFSSKFHKHNMSRIGPRKDLYKDEGKDKHNIHGAILETALLKTMMKNEFNVPDQYNEQKINSFNEILDSKSIKQLLYDVNNYEKDTEKLRRKPYTLTNERYS